MQRRAAIALEVARSSITDPATSLLLTASAYQARGADIEDRSSAESVLSGALGMMLAERESILAKSDQALLHELEQLTDKIKVAISIHVESVTRISGIKREIIGNASSRTGRPLRSSSNLPRKPIVLPCHCGCDEPLR